METVLKLFNPLKETFTFHWDKVPFNVPPKMAVTFQAFVARHGAKHLVDFIILHQETWPEACPNRGNTFGDDLTKGREELLAKVLLGVEDESTTKPEEKDEETDNSKTTPPRRGRPPKQTKEETEGEADEEFSDAKNLK